jgi:hypothetical protein
MKQETTIEQLAMDICDNDADARYILGVPPVPHREPEAQ